MDDSFNTLFKRVDAYPGSPDGRDMLAVHNTSALLQELKGAIERLSSINAVRWAEILALRHERDELRLELVFLKGGIDLQARTIREQAIEIEGRFCQLAEALSIVEMAQGTLAASRFLVGKYTPDHHWLPEHDKRIEACKAFLAKHGRRT